MKLKNKTQTHKLNESYSVIDDTPEKINQMFEYLKVEIPGAYFDRLVKSGFKSPFEYFGRIQDKKLLVMNGHVPLLSKFGAEAVKTESDFTEEQVDEFLKNIKNQLPFSPFDYQEKAFKESILNSKQINRMCTSSGKSLTIALIAEFFRQQGKKGILLVPNINLLTQIKSDLLDYKLTDLHNDTHTIGGGSDQRNFDKTLTISTWQSLQERFVSNLNLDSIDYVICDECLHPETLVTTNNGQVEIQKIRVGDYVLTLNEATGLKEYKPVLKIHKNLSISSKEKMFKINLADGTHLKITGNHKVNTTRGWIRADELNIEDEIISE